MSKKTPLVLLPGLLCSESLWQHQIAGLADIADCTVADLTGQETMAAIWRASPVPHWCCAAARMS